jgi:hypothetical protein
MGGPGGWATGGVVGGLGAALLASQSSELHLYIWHSGAFAILIVPALLGVVLGLAAHRGIRTGRSPLPVVTVVARAIADSEATVRAGAADRPPPEVVPSPAPDARGDEVSPARDSQAAG